MAGGMAVGLLMETIGGARAQQGVVRSAIQLPGPPPERLKDLDCKRLQVLRGSVMNMNSTLVREANINSIELINFEQQSSAAHCDNGNNLTPSSACHYIMSQIADLEAQIQNTTSDFNVLSEYNVHIDNAAKVKDCSFEQQ
ncbi:MAG TPA: hypothetical protein VMF86_17560 [Stellaceae bacterium]|nr:hypothetical protein [Stellaceae bacterium]